jgi:hypothetical protein
MNPESNAWFLERAWDYAEPNLVPNVRILLDESVGLCRISPMSNAQMLDKGVGLCSTPWCCASPRVFCHFWPLCSLMANSPVWCILVNRWISHKLCIVPAAWPVGCMYLCVASKYRTGNVQYGFTNVYGWWFQLET